MAGAASFFAGPFPAVMSSSLKIQSQIQTESSRREELSERASVRPRANAT
jgi:hypothetical protein